MKVAGPDAGPAEVDRGPKNVVPLSKRFSVRSLMRRIRLAASFSGVADRSGTAGSGNSGPLLRNWSSAESSLAVKAQYELSELLRASDEDFVSNAYRAILRRPADPSGLEVHVTLLRDGAMDKVDILAALRWSEEGIRRGVHINGLLIPHLLRKWGRKPVVGAILRWTHAILTLHRGERRLAQMENILARDLQGLGRHVGAVGDHVGSVLDRHEDAIGVLYEQMQQLRERLDIGLLDLRRHISDQDTRHAEAERRQEKAIERLHGQLQQSHNDNETLLVDLNRRMSLHDARHAETERSRAAAIARSAPLDGLYSEFEKEFRGSRDLIRARLEPYMDLLRDAGAGSEDRPVLDLGSGRGEWLEILRDAGLVAKGVDTSETFIRACAELGLDVELADAVAALAAQPEATLGAVTTMHLIEHLPFEDVVALIDQSRRVLKAGGVLIIETPNPENLRVASHNFYLDPTHRNPLPPVMMRWLVENRGFPDAEILRLTEHRPWPRLPRLPESSEVAASLNPLIEWAEVAPDYAIVARRPHD